MENLQMQSLFKNQPILSDIIEIISKIQPFDLMEEQHIANTIEWIKSGTPIFRTQKPAIPNKHLVSYFLLFDEETNKVLLVDHKKAQLWLPSGGHVEINEHPLETVKRECLEELGIEADFWCNNPIFLTSTMTSNISHNHTDVSLWYILNGKHQQHYNYDVNEFHGIQWFDFDAIPYDKADPHMLRFVSKLKTISTKKMAAELGYAG